MKALKQSREAAAGDDGRDAEPSDQELVARALTGDQSAFALLYQRYSPVVGRRLLRILRRRSDAQDVLQMTFLQVHRTLARYRPDASFSAWVQGIGYRVAGTYLRSRKRRWWSRPAADWEIDQVIDPHKSGEVIAIERQTMEMVHKAVAELSADLQIAFALHEIEGLGVTEIGEFVGASPQTVWARVRRARSKVLARLAPMVEHAPEGNR